MEYFRFGSADSIDHDMFYRFDEMPNTAECKAFCASKEIDNKNIIVIKDGIIIDTFKGTPDEVNNILFHTYSLHEQKFPNPIERTVERSVPLKTIRAIRIILSYLSRTEYRSEIKRALLSLNFKNRLDTLSKLDFRKFENGFGNRKGAFCDICKSLAFQIGQTLALILGKEVYTKKEISELYPELEPFLYRREKLDFNVLNKYNDLLLNEVYEWMTILIYDEDGKEEILFQDFNCKINMQKERIVKV
jgi:hypothetical protein